MSEIMQGFIDDIQVDSSITVITIIDENDKENVCYAETRMFLESIDSAFNGEWKGASIEYELDTGRVMKWFNPL